MTGDGVSKRNLFRHRRIFLLLSFLTIDYRGCVRGLYAGSSKVEMIHFLSFFFSLYIISIGADEDESSMFVLFHSSFHHELSSVGDEIPMFRVGWGSGFTGGC